MPEPWRELLVWTFKGRRFNERGIDLRDLDVLSRLRELLLESAKEAWHRRNPLRERLPPNADEHLALRIFGFAPGSCQVAVYYAPPLPPQPSWEEPDDPTDLSMRLPEAAHFVMNALREAAAGRPIPDEFPRSAMPTLERLTAGLGPGETVSVRVPRVPPSWTVHAPTPPSEPAERPSRPAEGDDEVVLDAALHAEVSRQVLGSANVERALTGEVTMASLRGKAHLRFDGYEVPFDFPQGRARDVTRALHEHETVRLRLRGSGELDLKSNRLKRFTATDLVVLPAPDPSAPSEALFERLASDDPQRLLGMLAPGATKPSVQTFAAEVAGRLLPHDQVVPVLLALLEAPHPLAREGAVLGLAHHLDESVVETLKAIERDDPSPGVRATARDVLEGR